MRTLCFIWLLAWVALGGTAQGAEAEPDSLNWQSRSNRVDARVRAWPLNKVLGRVAKATGWEVFIEPGTQTTVTAGFSGLTQREALTRLLGDLSFALLPRTNAAARLLIYRTDRDSATERVLAEGEDGESLTTSTNRIPNELIIRLKPGSKLKPEELARLLGAKLVGSLDEFGAYRLRFDSAEEAAAARAALNEFPDELAVEDNFPIPRPDTVVEIGAGATPLTLRPAVLGDKDGIVIALIDTAVQALPKEYEAFLLSRTSLADGQAAGAGPLHGTSMFETLLLGGQAADQTSEGSKLRVRAYDVYGGSETTTSFDIARAIALGAKDGATIFNLSLGSSESAPLLRDVIWSVSQQGALVLAAAGNEPGTAPNYPAADPGALAVTALGRDGQPASWANTGSFVDLAAPGSALVPFNGRTYRISGTSASTAWVSGYAASTAARTATQLSQMPEVLRQQIGFQPKKP